MKNIVVIILLVVFSTVVCAEELKTQVKCPICVKEGKKSKVYQEGCMTTLLGWTMYYDEEGNYHSHDPNVTTCSMRCSNGHKFTINFVQPSESINRSSNTVIIGELGYNPYVPNNQSQRVLDAPWSK